MDLLGLGLESEDTKRKVPPIQERHLNSPIQLHKKIIILEGKNIPHYLKRSHKIARWSLNYFRMSPELSPDTLHILRSSLYQKYSKEQHNLEPIYKRSMMESLELLRSGLLETLLIPTTALDPILVDNLFDGLEGLILLRKKLEDIVNLSTALNSRRVPAEGLHYHERTGPFRLYTYRIDDRNKIHMENNIGIWETPSLSTLIDHNDILMVSDYVSSRVMTLIGSSVYNKVDRLICPPSDLIRKVYNWMDHLLHKYGNLAFDRIKYLEPLMVSALIMNGEDDKYTDERHFFRVMMRELDHISDFEDKMVLSTWLDECIKKDTPPDWLSQIHGCFRHGGHPTVSSLDAVNKLKETGTEQKIIDYNNVDEIYKHMVKTFCLSYINKTGVWPRCHFLDTEDTMSEIRDSISSNRIPDERSPFYSHHDWMRIEFDQTFYPGEGWSLSTMMVDKSHSPGKAEVIEKMKKNPFQNIGDKLIMTTIKNEDQSVSDMLKDIDALGFDDDERVVGLRVKEREVKRTGRLFALLPYRPRMFYAATEHLISKNIIPYFSAITMTDSNLKLKKRMHNATKNQGTEGSTVVVNISVDYSVWNVHQRGSVHEKGFKMIDNLLGFDNLVSRSHDYISSSTLYLCDGSGYSYTDGSSIKGEGSYTDHIGGLEGQRQKAWTIFTTSGIEMVASKRGVKSSVLGQGDNQIITLSFDVFERDEDGSPTTSEVERIKKTVSEILGGLDTLFNSIGMKLKKEETWVSSKLFIYGKVIYLNGKPLSNSLKKCSRATYMVNDGYPSLNGSLASVGTAMLSMCESDVTPLVPMVVCNAEMIRSILEHCIYDITQDKGLLDLNRRECMLRRKDGKENRDVAIKPEEFRQAMMNSKELHWMMILTNSSLGGLSVPSFYSTVLKLFPDPVTESVSFLKSLFNNTRNENLKMMIRRVLSLEFKNEVDLKMLLLDPTSLNVLVPIKEDNVIKSFATRYLNEESSLNVSFKRLLGLARDESDKLVKYLSDCRPFAPRILSDIYGCAPFAQFEKIVSRIKKTNTIQGKIYQFEGDNLTISMTKAARMAVLNVYFMCQKREATMSKPPDNPTLFSLGARERGWKIKLEGVTAPHPFSLLTPCKVDRMICEDSKCTLNVPEKQKNYITVVVNPESVNLSTDELRHKLGSSTPYVGSMTSEKATQYKKMVPVNLFENINRPLSLMRLPGWATEKNSNLSELLRILFRCYTDFDPDRFNETIVLGSGSPSHRYKDMMTKHGGIPVLLHTPTTHLMLSTTTLENHSKGGDNETLLFQAMMIFARYSVTIDRIYRPEDRHIICYHMHVRDEKEILRVDESMMEIPHPPAPNIVTNPIKDRMLFVPGKSIEFKVKGSISGLKIEHVDISKIRMYRELQSSVGIRCGYKAMENGILDLRLKRVSSISDRATRTDLVMYYKVRSVPILMGALIKILEVVLSKASSNPPGPTELMRDYFYKMMLYQLEDLDSSAFTDLAPIMNIEICLNQLSTLGLASMITADVQLTERQSCEGIRSTLVTLLTSAMDTVSETLKYHVVVECDEEITPSLLSMNLVMSAISDSLLGDPIMALDVVLAFHTSLTNQQLFVQLSKKDSLLFDPVSKTAEELMALSFTQLDQGYTLGCILTNGKRILSFNTTLKGLFKDMMKIPMSSEDLRRRGRGRIMLDDDSIHLPSEIRFKSKMVNSHITEGESWKVRILSNPDDEGLDTIDSIMINSTRTKMFPSSFFNRTIKIGTTALPKLYTITKSLVKRYPGIVTNRVMSLGDGSGGWTAVILCTLDVDYVIFNSLVTSGDRMYHMIGEITCPLSHMLPARLRSKVRGKELLRSGISDFLKKDYPDSVQNYMRQSDLGESLDLIVCDAEHNGIQRPSMDIVYTQGILWNCYKLLNKGGTLVLKSYMSRNIAFDLCVSMCGESFEQSSVVRSPFSGDNSEVYLICYSFDPARYFRWRSTSQKLREPILPKMAELEWRWTKSEFDEVCQSMETTLGFNEIERKARSLFRRLRIQKDPSSMHWLELEQMIMTRSANMIDISLFDEDWFFRNKINQRIQLSFKEVMRLTSLLLTLRMNNPAESLVIPQGMMTLVYKTVDGRNVMSILMNVSPTKLHHLYNNISQRIRNGEQPNYIIWKISPNQTFMTYCKGMASLVGYLVRSGMTICECSRSKRKIGFTISPGLTHACDGTIFLGHRSRPQSTELYGILADEFQVLSNKESREAEREDVTEQ